MAGEFSGNRRTLRAYVCDLLEYPRWVIGHEVDFTHCRLGGHYNEFLPECTNCKFGPGCLWLDKSRSPKTDKAPLHELVKALDSAVVYLQSANRSERSDDPDTHAWIREARRFLRTQHEHAGKDSQS